MAKPNTVMTEAPAVHVPKKPKFVIVACKIPTGLQLQICKPTKVMEPTQSGPREITRWDRVGDRITVRGTARPVGQAPAGYVPAIMVDGYAMTPNVPAEFWDTWLEQNRDTDLVKNRLIYAMPSRADAAAMAKENRAVTSGLEPLRPEATGKDADPRMPRPASGSIAQITNAREGAPAAIDDGGAFGFEAAEDAEV